MKYLLAFAFSAYTSAAYLSPCYNYEDRVSFSYQACINNNFSQVASEINSFPSYCVNYGDSPSYSFISCINNNFQDSARRLGSGAYYPSCHNYGDRLSFSFISCVNSNFRDLEWDLNRKR
jgi:hypothetical protein